MRAEAAVKSDSKLQHLNNDAIMNDDVADTYCQSTETPPPSPVNDDPCINDCRRQFP